MSNKLEGNIKLDTGVKSLLKSCPGDISEQKADGISEYITDSLPGPKKHLLEFDAELDNYLNLTQQRILWCLVKLCMGRKKTYFSFYQKIGDLLGVTERTVMVQIAILEKKKYIKTSVIYRSGTRQRIGKRVAITNYTPIGIFTHEYHPTKQKRKEIQKAYDQKLELLKNEVL